LYLYPFRSIRELHRCRRNGTLGSMWFHASLHASELLSAMLF
jgi:hypothetical protein